MNTEENNDKEFEEMGIMADQKNSGLKPSELEINSACMFWDGINPEIAVVGIYGGVDAVGSHLKKESPASTKSTPFDNCLSVDDWIELTKPKETAPWYENIPKSGVLCWVYRGDNKKQIEIIDEYRENSDRYKFGIKLKNQHPIDKIFYDNAEPLTPEEAMNLVYQAEEETPKLEDKWLCWCFDNDETHARDVCFYDAENIAVFGTDGVRHGYVDFDNYEPIPRSQWPKWAVEAHNTLGD